MYVYIRDSRWLGCLEAILWSSGRCLALREYTDEGSRLVQFDHLADWVTEQGYKIRWSACDVHSMSNYPRCD